MRPFAHADGHDAPWLINEAVPVKLDTVEVGTQSDGVHHGEPPRITCVNHVTAASGNPLSKSRPAGGGGITEMVDSGPFRFLAGERVPGSRAVHEKFVDDVPRATGTQTLLRMMDPFALLKAV